MQVDASTAEISSVYQSLDQSLVFVFFVFLRDAVCVCGSFTFSGRFLVSALNVVIIASFNLIENLNRKCELENSAHCRHHHL